MAAGAASGCGVKRLSAEIGTRWNELAPNGAAGAPVDSCYTFAVCFLLDIYGFVL